MENIHERRFPGAAVDDLARLLDGLGQPGDRLWPNRSGRWPAMRLDGPLAPGARGGHGLIRYRVEAYEPGRSVTFAFHPGLGLDGIHRFDLLDPEPTIPEPGLRHTIEASVGGSMILAWPLAVRWLHDACIEELFDTAEIELGLRSSAVDRPGRWSRLLLWVGPSPEDEERRVRAAEA